MKLGSFLSRPFSPSGGVLLVIAAVYAHFGKNPESLELKVYVEDAIRLVLASRPDRPLDFIDDYLQRCVVHGMVWRRTFMSSGLSVIHSTPPLNFHFKRLGSLRDPLLPDCMDGTIKYRRLICCVLMVVIIVTMEI